MAKKKIGHIELHWTCPNCRSINPGPEKHCQNCGAAQPVDVEFEQSSRQELITEERKIVAAEAGADVHCPYCGSRNSAGDKVCLNCGGSLADGVERQSGRVLGAFKQGPAAEVTCPSCGTKNLETENACIQCGASLAVDDNEVQASISGVPSKESISKTKLIIIAAAGLVLILACGAYFFFATQINPTVGIVSGVNWQRSVPVEALVPVEYHDWKDEIPPEGDIASCGEQVRSIQEQPGENSVEVCGTPYSVDSGSGYAEINQDCTYEIYDTYCSYTVDEWSVVVVEELSGRDFSPQWPKPVLGAGQRLGEEWTESYSIVFDSGEEVYTYTTRDFNLYQLAQIGTEWTLNVNALGQLVSIENE